jgi:hypothetical protein
MVGESRDTDEGINLVRGGFWQEGCSRQREEHRQRPGGDGEHMGI